MDYRLGIEQSEPGKWIAWVFGLPGCFSRGATRTEAVAAAPQAIADYFNWRDGYNRVGEDDIEQIRAEVTEVFENYETLDGYWVNSFFDHDRRLVSAADADDARWLLDCTRSDLVRIRLAEATGRGDSGGTVPITIGDTQTCRGRRVVVPEQTRAGI